MKLYNLLLITFCIMAMSCSKEHLSCDPAIDAWAKENIKLYENSGRATFVQLPYSRQKAIYRGLSSEKKVELWKERYNQICTDERLTENEKQALNDLYLNLSPLLFENKKAWNDFQPYLRAWEKRMILDYGWNNTDFFIYCHTWMNEAELRTAVLYDSVITRSDPFNPELNSEQCTCLTDTFCAFAEGKSFCVIENNECKVYDGCGIWGNDNCEGTCRDIKN